MSSVDNRIVDMQFNSKQFTQGATDSQKSLDSLEKSLSNAAKSRGLDDMAKGVDGLASHFSAMEVAGVTAIATIANKAVNAGLQLVKSFTIDPITDGFKEYQTTLQSTQTIVSNTGQSVAAVGKQLDVLNTFSDQTIYNFGQMAKNIGTFTAAGVQLEPAVSAIKGIANLAALSGSSADQASGAMYQLSQAIAAGRVNLQDWNSVVNAGMGGKQFQTNLATTALAMGKLNTNAVKFDKQMKLSTVNGQTFRESISAAGQQPWLTGDVLTTSLATLDGRFSTTAQSANIAAKEFEKNGRVIDDATLKHRAANAVLKARNDLEKQGIKFTNKQFEALKNQGEAAFVAATQIKTLPQLMGVIRESIGSTFAAFFRATIGDYNQSVKLFTGIGDVVSKMTGNVSKRILLIAQAWNDVKSGFGGRLDFLDALSQIAHGLGRTFEAVGKAFRSVFPPSGVAPLMAITSAFAAVAHVVTAMTTGGNLENLQRTFAGLFAVLHIGWTVIKLITGAFFGFIGALLPGAGKASVGILGFTAKIGDMLVALDKFLTSGGKMVDFFKDIGSAAGNFAAQGLSIAGNVLMGLLNGLTAGAAFGSLRDAVMNVGQNIIDWFKEALGIASPAAELIPVGQNIIMGVIVGIQMAAKLLWSGLMAVVHGIGSIFQNLFGDMNALDFAQVFNAITTGLAGLAIYKGITGVTAAFNQVTDTFQTMQHTLQAKTLQAIAIAIALLVASVIAMQFIDAGKIAIGTTAIGTLLAMMTIAMKVMAGMGSKSIAPSVKEMTAGTARILALGAAMVQIATAIAILSGAVILLGSQKPETLEKGLIAMTVSLGVMVAAVAVISSMKGAVFGAAAGMVAMASAMVVLSAAVLAFGVMKTDIIKKGLTAIAIGLGIFVAAIAILGAIGPSTILGAGAIFIVASALAKLIPVILILGVTPWSVITQGMKAMAIGLGILLAAGALAIVVAPGLIVLAAALAALGFAFLGAGAGMLMFATGFALLTATGVAGVAIMGAAIEAFIALLPAIATQIVAAFVSFVQALALAAPKVRKAMSVIIENIIGVLLDAIPELTKLLTALMQAGLTILFSQLMKAIPMIGKLLQKLVDTAINVLHDSIAHFVSAGMDLVIALLKGVADHVPDILKQTTRIIVAFIKGIGAHAAKIVTAGAEAMLQFLEALDAAIVKYSDKFRNIGLKIAGHIIDGMTFGLAGKAAGVIGSIIPGNKKANGDITFEEQDGLGVSPGGNPRDPNGKRRKPKATSTPTDPFVRALGGKGAKNISNAVAGLVANAVRMGNSITAKGDPAVGKAAAAASMAQIAADKAAAKQFATRSAANKIAKVNPKLAKAMRKSAEDQQKAVDAAKAKAETAAQKVTDAEAFRDADNMGKGDIKNKQAQQQADRSAELLTKANAEAAAGRKLLATNRKAGLAMLDQAKKDAQAAKKYAADAEASHAKAQEFYALEVNDRITALALTEKDRQDQITFDAANDEAKEKLLQQRIETNQTLADTNRAKAEALIARATSLAATDSVQAMKLLDEADALLAAAGTAESSVASDKDAMQNIADSVTAVEGRITQFEADRKAEADEAAAQAELDAATDAEKSAILAARSKADQAIADAKNAQALSLIAQAKEIASTDAAAAAKLVDQAEALVAEAKEAADKAKSEADAAKSAVDSTTSDAATGSQLGGGSSLPSDFKPIRLSRTIMEEAASSMDRYTASLAQASAMAGAGPSSVQYTQNNYSPATLSASDIYRQSKNLISANSVKMGAN